MDLGTNFTTNTGQMYMLVGKALITTPYNMGATLFLVPRTKPLDILVVTTDINGFTLIV